MNYNSWKAQEAANYAAQITLNTKCCPEPSSTVYGNTFNLWDIKPSYTNADLFSARISFPAIATMANGQTIIATLQTSPDSANWASTGNSVTVTGAGGVGSPATVGKFALPIPYAQYFRWALVASSGNAGASAVNATCDIFYG